MAPVGAIKTSSLALAFVCGVMASPLFGGITTNQISLAICFIAIVGSLGSGERTLNRGIFTPLIPAVVAATFSVVSYVIGGGEFWAILSWILLGVLAVCIAYVSGKLRSRQEFARLYAVMALSGFFILLYIATDAYFSGVLFGGYRLRAWVDQEIAVGLSKMMNGLTVIACISYVAWSSRLITGVFSRFFAVAMYFGLVLFAVLAGSRQTLLALFLALLCGVYYSRGRRVALKLIYGSLVGAACYGMLYLGLSQGVIESTWLEERLVSTTLSGNVTSGDQERLYLLIAGLKMSVSNAGLGVGPDNFYHLVGRFPHNGYLGLYAELGVVGATMTLLTLGLVLWRSKGARSLYVAPVTATFAILSLVMMNFNDLLRDPVFWTTFGLLVGINISANREGRGLRSISREERL